MLYYLMSVIFFVFMCVLGTKRQLFEDERCISESDGFNGTCVSWRRCLSVVNDIRNRIHPQLCSFHGEEPIVCCTDCDLVNDTSNVLVDKDGNNYFKTGSKAKDKCLEYTITLNYSCSRKDGKKRELDYFLKNCYTYSAPFFISAVGGVDAMRGEYPHMALLGYGDSLDSAQWLCGGSVISDRFILTAAHCASSHTLGSVKFIALGILKRSDPPDTWQRYVVRRIITHPQYRSPSKYHDIALLETGRRIEFNRAVLPACLGTGENSDNAIATGWGALGYRRDAADTLQIVKLQQFTEKECAGAFPPNRNLLQGYNHDTQACYGDKDNIIDTCPGDSGGPLQVVSSDGPCIYEIVGVTSFGTACGFKGSSGIYTKVVYYKTWIENIVWP